MVHENTKSKLRQKSILLRLFVALFLVGLGLIATFATTRSAAASSFYVATGGSSVSAPKDDCKDPDISKDCKIVEDITLLINVLSAAVGVVVVGMIIAGGIQYSISGDDPQAVAKAKSRITSALLALVVFIFSYAFLQWIVPGGIL